MKKLLFSAVLLGLTGCGETDQNDTTQTTLQSSQVAPTSVNYRMAASASTMSASAASFGGWNPLSLKPVGASSLLNASKTLGGITTDSHVLITPAVKDVTKVLVRGAGGLVLSVAVEELLGAVDWVMDPANNQIVYSKPNDASKPPTICQNYFKAISATPYVVAYGCSIPQVAANYCKERLSKQNVQGCSVSKITSESFFVETSCIKWDGSCYGIDSTIVPEYHFNPYYDPKENLSLDAVSQKIIDNAESENTDAQAVTLAAAQAILSEAENDATKAKEIEDELERNSKKCPNGESRNIYGQCWICDKSQFMPITRATRDAKIAARGKKCEYVTDPVIKATNAVFWRNLINARIQENACWSPVDPNHLIELNNNRNALSKCEN